jgi:hypothetical protein
MAKIAVSTNALLVFTPTFTSALAGVVKASPWPTFFLGAA